MQTVKELIEELQKLPPDNIVDIQVGHTIQLRNFPKPKDKPKNVAEETVMAEQGD